ncbi:hypothetical protein [Streptomyces mirabilis]|uniref:hypothetical protein n=1 Tax=Streptomyces mirabilis TaxID=68239 RepID=UPI0036747895
MVLGKIHTALTATTAALRGVSGGMWQAIRARIDGRNAVSFERERRTTLLTVPPALPTGARVYDKRADGSVLDISIPYPAHLDLMISGAVSPCPDRQPGTAGNELAFPAPLALEAGTTTQEQ